MPTARSKFFILILLLIFAFQGCAMFDANRKKEADKLEMLKNKKANYLALLKDLQDRRISAGAAEELVETKYGKPDDVINSSSNVSTFALWTYEFPDAAEEAAYRPLRLYFNNRKLTYWTN